MLDFLLHVDTYLTKLIADYGTLTYAILFGVVFAETGLVVTPFLPGDSLLFAAGTFAATGALRLDLVVAVLIAAAVLGDAVNYAVGRRLARAFLDDESRSSWMHKVVKREHVQRAHDFFDRHGGKAVVLARFVPIVRTFVPFVAGGAAMSYRVFAVYNVIGAVLWVGICVGAGYLFGNIPVVRENFELVVVAIVVVSVLPIVFEVIKNWRRTPGSQEGRA